ncbi:hypothetical protein BGW41_005572 [Actinomortierella wolfii]|nr:hypothetical protein BGW41_005572 [Actinomortierella wolfii]
MNFDGQQPTSAFGGGANAFGAQPQNNPTNPSSSSTFRGGFSGRGRGASTASFRGGRGGGFANMTYVAPGLQQQRQQQQQPQPQGNDMNDLDMDESDQQPQGFAGSTRGRGRGGGASFGRGAFHLNNVNNQSQGNTGAFGTSIRGGRKQGGQSRSLQWRAEDAQKTTDTNHTMLATTGGNFNSNESNNMSSSFQPAAATGSAYNSSSSNSNGGSLNSTGAGTTFSYDTPSAFSTSGNSKESGAFSAFGGNDSGSSSFFSGTASSGKTQFGNNSTKSTKDTSSIFNQEEADSRLARFSAVPTGNRYEELKEKRVIERENAIRSGAIPDPNKPRRLEDAIQFIGTCLDMCPEFERHEREYQQSLEKFEKIPGTESVNHAKAVKAFARPAAGAEQPLPSDVRPPHVLLSTLAYLMEHVIDENDLLDSHSFIRDRTRSIRQDFTLQNSRGIEAVKAHEIIARYHILCLHQLCEEEGEKFSQQQEMEQLRKVLTSLQEFYDDLRAENVYCENEAEFRAYHILSHLHDPDMLRQAQQLPRHLFNDPYIRIATEIQYMTRRNNDFLRRGKIQSEASPNFYSRFFKKIASTSTSYLFACLLEVSFVDIRKGALKAMNKAFLEMHGGYPAEELINTLGFDDLDECITNCQEYGLEVDTSKGQPMVLFGRRDKVTRRFIFHESTIPLKQHRNIRIVEAKRAGYTATQIIYGEAPPPMLKGVKTVAPPVASSARPTTMRLNPSAPAFAPGVGIINKPMVTSGINSQAPASVFRPATQPQQSAFNVQPPAAKPTVSPVPPSLGSSQFLAPKQAAATPAFNFGVTTATSVSPLSSISTAAPSMPGFSVPPSSTFTALPTMSAPEEKRITFPALPASSAQQPLTFTAPQPTAPTTTPPFLASQTTLPAPPSFSFQSSTQALPQASIPSQPAPTAPAIFTQTLVKPATLPAPVVPQPPILPPKPKSDDTRVVAASGMIYPRSVVNLVMEDLVNAALSGFVRSVVAEAQHDEKLNRSMEQSRLRQQRIRQESQALRDRTLDYVVQLMVSEVAREILQEHKLAKEAVARWKRFTAAARARKQELQRRQRSFMQNVQSMSSRAGLGDNPIKTQLQAYQEEQRRSMRRYNEAIQNQQRVITEPVTAFTTSAHANEDSVKTLVQATLQRQQQLRVEKIKELGNVDQAVLQQLEMLSAPKRERWAALDVNTIVHKGWYSTHPPPAKDAHELSSSHNSQQWNEEIKLRWSLQVNTPSLHESASQWIFSKLGVNITSQSRVLYKEHCSMDSGTEVIVYGTDDHSVAELLQVSKSTIAETSAFIFVFSNVPFTEDEATEDRIRRYWEREQSRLSGFLSCFPRVCQPIVFVMWGQSRSVWENMSPRMTEYLGLDKMVEAENGPILAYQFVFMTTQEPNPSRFIEGTLDWLAKASRAVDENPTEVLRDLFNKFQPYYEGTLARMSVAQAPMYSQYEADKADSAYYDKIQGLHIPDESNNLFVETVESALALAFTNFNLLLDHITAVVQSTDTGDELRKGAQQEQQVKQSIVRLLRDARLPVVVHGRFLDHIGYDLDARESFCDYVDRYVSTIGGIAQDHANAKPLKQLRSELRSIIMNSRADRTPIFEVTKKLTATISQWLQQAILKQWGAWQGVSTSSRHQFAFGRWLVGDEVDIQCIVTQYEKLTDTSVHAWEEQVMDRVAKFDERAEFIKAMKQYQEHRSAAAAAARMEEDIDNDVDLDDDVVAAGETETQNQQDRQQQQEHKETSVLLLTNGSLKRNAPVDVEQDSDKRAKTLSSLALLTKTAATGAVSVNSANSGAQQIFKSFGFNNISKNNNNNATASNYSFMSDAQTNLVRPRRDSTASMASVASSVLTTHSNSSKREDLLTRLRDRIKEVKSTILRS